jgi:bifunctional damage-control phosphatase, subfamily II, fusion protein
VSILKVESDEKFQRIGGSTVGGATLWGLGSLLTDAVGFDEILDLAEKGDNTNVDMLVKDIYGGKYNYVDLNEDLIACSLGKTTRSKLDNDNKTLTREQHLAKFKPEDLIKSILVMICFDLTQIACLHAKLNNIKKIYFGGYFIRNCELTMRFLKHGVLYWSQGECECLFLRHEGYLGAVGAFLKTTKESDNSQYSWSENYARSNPRLPHNTAAKNKNFDFFELNREEKQLIHCPFLLDSNIYIPDLIDLTKDDEARDYWLNCFEKTIETYEKQCIKSCQDNETLPAELRAKSFKNSYLSKLRELFISPSAYGILTVRSLLDLREHCMAEFDFVDIYSNEKHEENRLGVELLNKRLEYFDSIEDRETRLYYLFKGLLAGNVYDYGARAVIEKQKSGNLDKFQDAIDSIDDTLMNLNDFKQLKHQILTKTYNSICIFVDNSGFDIVLGVLPVVVEFLKNKTTSVILCANSKAAINDITYGELLIVIKKVCSSNPIMNEAFYESKRLIIMETGSTSPCLDLSRINIDLVNLMTKMNVDFIILEGMGRAIHTNYNAKFKCDSLKVAVLKNKWLAQRFNFFQDEKFPIVFKFEPIN